MATYPATLALKTLPTLKYHFLPAKVPLKTNKGNLFTLHSIDWIRFKHKIPSPILQRPEELSVNQVAAKFHVSHHVVRYWIERKMVNVRHIGTKLWISMNPEKEVALRNRVEHSTKIAIARSKLQTEIVRGAL